MDRVIPIHLNMLKMLKRVLSLLKVPLDEAPTWLYISVQVVVPIVALLLVFILSM
jgi:hypothetical protein